MGTLLQSTLNARTVIVQNGKAVRSYDTIMNAEWRRGVEMEKRLHNRMMEIVRPEMTFEEVRCF